ncbi:MAG: endonuclease/exonuclease/phosphatase family protein [Bryobacteraceae bacterium]
MRLLILLLTLATATWPAENLRVMTFNVRCAAAGDGDNRWEARRDILVRTIRLKRPDLIGTQELLKEQGRYIVEQAPEYAWFGLSRRGNHEDEHMGVFYRKTRLTPVESGNFWLSQTPDVPGSSSWGMSLPRMVTWARFKTSHGSQFVFYNTHFPHRGQDHQARLECARLIASRMAALDKDVPFLLTGDFNTPAGGDVQAVFTATLTDAWTATSKRSGPEGTFHGFRGVPRDGRIDWILYRGPWKSLEAETVTYNEDGRYPSDHFPAFTVLRLGAR